MVLSGGAEGWRRGLERLRTALLWVFWATSGSLVALALVRISGADAPAPVAGLARYTFWLYLPCYVIAAGAVLKRRWRLAALNGVLAVAHLAWVLPTVPAAGSMPFDIDRAPTVRVLAVNVSESNPTPGTLLTEIERDDPDIVVLVEYTTRWKRAVRRHATFAKRYPKRYEVVRDDETGIALFSRIPVAGLKSTDLDGWPLVRGTVTLSGEQVRIYGVHAIAPGRDAARHRTQHEHIRALLSAEPEGRALVVAGDFESTPFERSYREYEELGLDSAHEQRGRGFAATYPNDAGWPRSWFAVRIDHVLLSEELVAVRIREGEGAGSDHRPVIVDLAFRPKYLIDRSR